MHGTFAFDCVQLRRLTLVPKTTTLPKTHQEEVIIGIVEFVYCTI